MAKKILVTGGAGFVGSNLCERLASDPSNTVYSLDNYFTGSRDNHVDNVTYIEGETANIFKLVDFKPDLIFHLGEYARVEQSFDDLDDVWRMNMNGTIEVLKFSLEHKCKVVYAGSSTKFGDDGLGKNASPYAFTKSSNSQLVQNFGEWYGLEYAVVYFYNVYGSREIATGKYATLIALFKDKMKNGKTLTVRKPGSQERNFTHVDDIVDGLLLVGEKGKGDEYGIGSDEAFSILDVANMFGGEIEYLPNRPGNRQTADVVTSKTRQLGWRPQRKLEDHIKEFNKDL